MLVELALQSVKQMLKLTKMNSWMRQTLDTQSKERGFAISHMVFVILALGFNFDLLGVEKSSDDFRIEGEFRHGKLFGRSTQYEHQMTTHSTYFPAVYNHIYGADESDSDKENLVFNAKVKKEETKLIRDHWATAYYTDGKALTALDPSKEIDIDDPSSSDSEDVGF